MLTLDQIQEAAQRIAPYVVRTPMLECAVSPDLTIVAKPECLQSIGAFKIRGAFNVMLQLPKGTAGVVAHSSGNHAQAVARAARVLGMPAVIVMPEDAPRLKRARVEADGADVVTVGTDSEERRERADEIAESQGLALVPPYDHEGIAAGQGTAVLELLQDLGQRKLDAFYAPVSGGGLMAGCAVAIKALSPKTEVIGVEPTDANDTFLSLQKGERVMIDPPRTIADGLRVRTPGKVTWPILAKTLDGVSLVTDEEMQKAMAWALEHLRVVLEPSGAAALAAALRDASGTVGVLLSGGNVDPEVLKAACGFLSPPGES